MAKRTELKVDISCEKCKQKVLKAVSGLEGIDKIDANSEKGTLVVTGDVDPIDVIVRVRKAGKRAEIITIGPPPKPEEKKKEDEKKKAEEKKKGEEKKKEPQYFFHIPSNYPTCSHQPVVIVDDYCHTSCNIM
ncbi:hypothetical protein LUZ60_009803 [Juncus effusus]|nr:hypothetical protein LUZ60_009803 [Juncus effusus]